MVSEAALRLHGYAFCCSVNNPHPANDLVSGVTEILQPLYQTLNIRVTRNACPKELKVRQDRGLVQSVWEHSISLGLGS